MVCMQRRLFYNVLHCSKEVSSTQKGAQDDSEINSAELTSCDESHLRLLADAFQFLLEVCGSFC